MLGDERAPDPERTAPRSAQPRRVPIIDNFDVRFRDQKVTRLRNVRLVLDGRASHDPFRVLDAAAKLAGRAFEHITVGHLLWRISAQAYNGGDQRVGIGQHLALRFDRKQPDGPIVPGQHGVDPARRAAA